MDLAEVYASEQSGSARVCLIIQTNDGFEGCKMKNDIYLFPSIRLSSTCLSGFC